jgi:2-polyprenyl-3-methyl-5-hydroxy-6-metoxy-1,4-benzoquinol methylase
VTPVETSQPERPICVICGRQADDFCALDDAQYRICGGCGLVFQHPLPTRGAMVAWADNEYASGAYRDYVQSRPMKIRHFEDRLADVGPGVRPGRLLDVGCSCGYFMEVAAAHGFDVHGVEFSQNAIAVARPDIRARIFEGSLENLPDTGPFDVVSAFDLIEHVPDPRAFLRNCAKRLRPGGMLLVSTPDTGHFLRYVMRSRWPMLQPMQHLHLFSRQAMAQALRSEGFDDVRVETAYKTLSMEYLINQIRSLNPVLSKMLGTMSRAAPQSVLQRYRRVNIGEILAVARRV